MKKIYVLLFLAVTAFAVSSCNDDEGNYIVDWAPVNLYIYAKDANGNDLVKKDMEGMTLTFKGETYAVTTRPSTRYYATHMNGLVFQEGKEYSKSTTAPNRLVFGEIDGSADMDEVFVLMWPDGSKNIIQYHCSNHEGGSNPSCKRIWKLDGKSHEGSEFKFVK